MFARHKSILHRFNHMIFSRYFWQRCIAIEAFAIADEQSISLAPRRTQVNVILSHLCGRKTSKNGIITPKYLFIICVN